MKKSPAAVPLEHTISLSDKQRASLAAFREQREAINARENLYVLAILEGAKGVPDAWSGVTITDAGLVLGPAGPGTLTAAQAKAST
jgi:hypothetical protein